MVTIPEIIYGLTDIAVKWLRYPVCLFDWKYQNGYQACFFHQRKYWKYKK